MTKCAFPGCPNDKSPKAAKGLCNSHYWQMHKGRELTPLSYRRDVTRPWILEHVDYHGDDCLIWPFQTNKNGYPMVKWNRKQSAGTRVMCELAHGKPPTPKHEAAHSCGKGHLGCINPSHLSWKTPVENAADKILHGTNSPNGRVNEQKVRAIREFAHTCEYAVIAELLDVGVSNVGKIVRRETWSHVT